MIIFTRHAILKLGQRNISRNLVVKTLNAPDKILPTSENRKAAFKKFRKLYFKVIFRREGGDIIVITQYWTDKIGL